MKLKGIIAIEITAAILISATFISSANAQTRTWNGNTSGNWSTSGNWNGSDIPDTPSEDADLPDVTSGTRTVTVDAPYSIGVLSMTQTSAGINKLLLNSTLNLTTEFPLDINATAGTNSIQIDLNGQALNTVYAGSSIVNLDGTINADSGSSMSLEFGSGNSQHGMIINNIGVLYQNHSTITYQWNATSANNSSTYGRHYNNTGTWIMTNGASFLYSGLSTPGGFGLLSTCTNSGTLKVLDGSTNTFGTLFNDGTLELGDNSIIGNANSTLSSLAEGVVNITGTNALLGAATDYINNTAYLKNSGTLNVGDGVNKADLIIRCGSTTLTNAPGGLVLLNNAELILRYAGNGGNFRFDNTGVVTQDNSSIIFDWAATGNGSSSIRNFINTGKWSLINDSEAISYSSTGRPLTWCLAACENSGTIELLSGSMLQFRNLTNTGTLELGTNSILCGKTIIDSNPNLYNYGNVVASGDTLFGAITNESTKTITFKNGSSTIIGSTLNVGDGTNTPTFMINGGGTDTLWNYPSNTINIAAGAKLAVCVYDDGVSHPYNLRTAKIVNEGDLNLAGTLQQNGNHRGNVPVENSGTLRVEGDVASFELLQAASTVYTVPTINNYTNGMITGTGIMTYSNSTGRTANDTLIVDNIAGTVAPGYPSGNLELINTAVNMTNSTFSVSVSNDVVCSSMTLSGTGAEFNLNGSDNVLKINLIDEDIVPGDYTWRILTSPSINGTFGSIDTPEIGEWNAVYGSDYIDLNGDIPLPFGTLLIIE